MKVMELPGWPPEATGTFDPRRGPVYGDAVNGLWKLRWRDE
jgi:hypothetical protein